MTPGRTILILAGLSSTLSNFRGPLIETLVARGHRVHAAAPGMSSTVLRFARQALVVGAANPDYSRPA